MEGGREGEGEGEGRRRGGREEGGREGEREGRREGGREGGRKPGRKERREGGMNKERTQEYLEVHYKAATWRMSSVQGYRHSSSSAPETEGS